MQAGTRWWSRSGQCGPRGDWCLSRRMDQKANRLNKWNIVEHHECSEILKWTKYCFDCWSMLIPTWDLTQSLHSNVFFVQAYLAESRASLRQHESLRAEASALDGFVWITSIAEKKRCEVQVKRFVVTCRNKGTPKVVKTWQKCQRLLIFHFLHFLKGKRTRVLDSS